MITLQVMDAAGNIHYVKLDPKHTYQMGLDSKRDETTGQLAGCVVRLYDATLDDDVLQLGYDVHIATSDHAWFRKEDV